MSESKKIFLTSWPYGKLIPVDVLGKNDRIKDGIYIRYPHGGTDTTKNEFLFDLPDELNSTNKDGESLLMMFIRDSYASSTGKPSKKTAVALMKYVASDPELQKIVNNCDSKKILKYRR